MLPPDPWHQRSSTTQRPRKTCRSQEIDEASVEEHIDDAGPIEICQRAVVLGSHRVFGLQLTLLAQADAGGDGNERLILDNKEPLSRERRLMKGRVLPAGDRARQWRS